MVGRERARPEGRAQALPPFAQQLALGAAHADGLPGGATSPAGSAKRGLEGEAALVGGLRVFVTAGCEERVAQVHVCRRVAVSGQAKHFAKTVESLVLLA